MNAFERDFFTDPELIRDPAPYYAALRELGPVVREPHHGVFLLSGIEEILAVYADLDAFSSVVAPLGPFVKLPKPAEGESIVDVNRASTRRDSPERPAAHPSTLPSTPDIGRCSTSSSHRTVSRRTRSSCGPSPTG